MTCPIHVLNFGSLNIDYVYAVPHFVAPKETMASFSRTCGAGGKGLNQSIAMARAGINVAHAGKIGPEGAFLAETLQQAKVNTQWIIRGDIPTGHAIIQVDPHGQNAILLYPGANCALTPEEIQEVLSLQPAGRWLLLQNEVNLLDSIIRQGKAQGMKLAFNPAPCTEEINQLPLEMLDLLVVNEVEAAMLTHGSPDEPTPMLEKLTQRCPNAEVIITLGEKGAVCGCGHQRYAIPATRAEKVVDTTSAGDTFIGYYLAARLRDMAIPEALNTASRAAAITVSRPGAATSIPMANEIFG